MRRSPEVIRCRVEAPLPGRGWASHFFTAFLCAVRGPASFVEFYLLYSRSREIFHHAADEFE